MLLSLARRQLIVVLQLAYVKLAHLKKLKQRIGHQIAVQTRAQQLAQLDHMLLQTSVLPVRLSPTPQPVPPTPALLSEIAVSLPALPMLSKLRAQQLLLLKRVRHAQPSLTKQQRELLVLTVQSLVLQQQPAASPIALWVISRTELVPLTSARSVVPPLLMPLHTPAPRQPTKSLHHV
jgi:hypothetical protein